LIVFEVVLTLLLDHKLIGETHLHARELWSLPIQVVPQDSDPTIAANLRRKK
jgi:hypothetical protein